MLHGASFRNGRCWWTPARLIQKAADTEGGALNSSQEPKNWGRMLVKIPKQTRHAHSSHKQDSFGQWVPEELGMRHLPEGLPLYT